LIRAGDRIARWVTTLPPLRTGIETWLLGWAILVAFFGLPPFSEAATCGPIAIGLILYLTLDHFETRRRVVTRRISSRVAEKERRRRLSPAASRTHGASRERAER
jgi:hypothetical protein